MSSIGSKASAFLFARPGLSLALLLAPALLWLGVVYLGTLSALLVQGFFSVDELREFAPQRLVQGIANPAPRKDPA